MPARSVPTFRFRDHRRSGRVSCGLLPARRRAGVYSLFGQAVIDPKTRGDESMPIKFSPLEPGHRRIGALRLEAGPARSPRFPFRRLSRHRGGFAGKNGPSAWLPAGIRSRATWQLYRQRDRWRHRIRPEETIASRVYALTPVHLLQREGPRGHVSFRRWRSGYPRWHQERGFAGRMQGDFVAIR